MQNSLPSQDREKVKGKGERVSQVLKDKLRKCVINEDAISEVASEIKVVRFV